MISYILEDKDIQIVKDILEEYEFPYAIHGNELFAEKNVEIILEAEGILYKKD